MRRHSMKFEVKLIHTVFKRHHHALFIHSPPVLSQAELIEDQKKQLSFEKFKLLTALHFLEMMFCKLNFMEVNFSLLH